jgi:hypothetical protein
MNNEPHPIPAPVPHPEPHPAPAPRPEPRPAPAPPPADVIPPPQALTEEALISGPETWSPTNAEAGVDASVRNLLKRTNENIWMAPRNKATALLQDAAAPALGFLGGLTRQVDLLNILNNPLTPAIVRGARVAPVAPANAAEWLHALASSGHAPGILGNIGLEVGKSVVPTAVAVGGAVAAGQMVLDAYRILARGWDHRRLAIQSLMRKTTGIEAGIMKKISLGNKGNIDQLNKFGDMMRQGLFSAREIVQKNVKMMEKLGYSIFDSIAGYEAIDTMAPEKVRQQMTVDDKIGRENAINAFRTFTTLLKDGFTIEQRVQFKEKFDDQMKKLTRVKTGLAWATRGGSQFLRAGPWAIGGALLGGVYNLSHGFSGISGKILGLKTAGLKGTSTIGSMASSAYAEVLKGVTALPPIPFDTKTVAIGAGVLAGGVALAGAGSAARSRPAGA